MAEDVASGLPSLASARDSSANLYKIIESFKPHPRKVRELLKALKELNVDLRNLSQTSGIDAGVNSFLEGTLKQCSHACEDFGKELEKYSRNGASWARFKYGGGDDIGTFRKQVMGYKAPIAVSLSFAEITPTCVEAVQSCRSLIDTTIADLEDYLHDIELKLKSLCENTSSEPDAGIVDRMENERLSTEGALRLCRQLSQHIDKLQDEHVDKLRGEAEALRHGLKFCSNVASHLEKQMNKIEGGEERDPIQFAVSMDNKPNNKIISIENDAKGDGSIQLAVSTDGNPINGKNTARGHRARQLGGHMAGSSLVQVVRNFTMAQGESGESRKEHSPDAAPEAARASEGGFRGRGFTLGSNPPVKSALSPDE